MDKKLDDILKTLPGKPPRSRLTSYANLIDELRNVAGPIEALLEYLRKNASQSVGEQPGSFCEAADNGEAKDCRRTHCWQRVARQMRTHCHGECSVGQIGG